MYTTLFQNVYSPGPQMFVSTPEKKNHIRFVENQKAAEDLGFTPLCQRYLASLKLYRRLYDQ